MAISFDFINERIATGGGLRDYEDVERLVTAGITHTIDCTWAESDQSFSSAGAFASHPALTCLWNPTEDNGERKDAAWFAESIDFGFMALSKPYSKLYCHCDKGHNRGPSTALAVLLAMGSPFNDAVELIHEKRPITKDYLIYAVDAANACKELGYS